MLGGDPAGVAEEAPTAPLGKRSLFRKSTAVFKQDLKSVIFPVTSAKLSNLKDTMSKANPSSKIICVV
ncbi:hypothetical protein FZC76_15555 [Sutcliffiella horikoshii]|uniref:Uncharacterized protein n=1 Tax=Sutcliffiella horikoshii TaxID=79883 RepID=A0A5D4SYR6_9BACI|nr:hypothetical protein FZC76_15555 [Sutcliffiella horikoshii]